MLSVSFQRSPLIFPFHTYVWNPDPYLHVSILTFRMYRCLFVDRVLTDAAKMSLKC